jgi:hypothetical protein
LGGIVGDVTFWGKQSLFWDEFSGNLPELHEDLFSVSPLSESEFIFFISSRFNLNVTVNPSKLLFRFGQ